MTAAGKSTGRSVSAERLAPTRVKAAPVKRWPALPSPERLGELAHPPHNQREYWREAAAISRSWACGRERPRPLPWLLPLRDRHAGIAKVRSGVSEGIQSQRLV